MTKVMIMIFMNMNALFTVEDSNKLRGEIKGSHSKNLFLKNKKNKFLFIFM